MGNLTRLEQAQFENIFGMSSGYVLDFSDRTFQEFVHDIVKKDIHSNKYSLEGSSKAKKLRTFWKVEPDSLIALLNNALLERWRENNIINDIEISKKDLNLFEECNRIVAKLNPSPHSLEKHKTAFISYSWDSDAHQQWVIKLANKLRKDEGVEANVDIFETQISTVNLNQMMINNMQSNDFIVFILTEKYAEKANAQIGGVGFETILSLPLLRKEPNKLIFLLRHQGKFEKAFPFHLDGYYAIDFSDDSQFDLKFEELMHRINGVPLYKMEELGSPKVRKPKDLLEESISNTSYSHPAEDFIDIEIPILKRITDRDIELFMKESFKIIIKKFNALLSYVGSQNSNFEYDYEEISNYKSIFKLYIDGTNVTSIKIWFGDSFSRNTINLSHGRNTTAADNSTNEIITHEVDENKNLKLKMIIHTLGENISFTPENIVKEIWHSYILAYIR